MAFLFYLFSSFQIVSAFRVIQSKNPVYSVLFLILVFFNSSALLLLLGLDLFALLFLVVYVGAIAVLFLFVVMMLNVKLVEINEKRLRYLPLGAFFVLLFFFEMFLIFEDDVISVHDANINQSLPESSSSLFESSSRVLESSFQEYSQLLDTSSNIQTIGLAIYTNYFLFFLIASLILLVAMIGAIVLTMHKTVAIKRQKVFQQNTRDFGDTVQLFS